MPARAVAAVATRLVLAAAALAALAWAWEEGRHRLPPQWNPWAPLDLAEPPGPFTAWKLRRATATPAACTAWLDTAGMRHTPVADRIGDDGCGWQNASRVSGLGRVTFSSTFVLACPAVARLALWERHGLQPAAEQHLGSRVAAIEHLGSYACRNVYGQAEGRRSQHATANAFDIAGFRLADGRRVSVLRDWRAAPDDAPQPAFLRAAHGSACRFFAGVLGPEYNAAHRDHFHFDQGPYRVCR